MVMLADCIDKIFEKMVLCEDENDRELYKSAYYHLCDYKDTLDLVIKMTNNVNDISHRWELVKKSQEE